MKLNILSAGAAKGLVTALQSQFGDDTGAAIEGDFGAVGAMREKFLAGEPCDVLILTAAHIDALTQQGHLVAGSGAPLGRVRTGVAVRAGQPLPAVSDASSLAASLKAAVKGVYIPDPVRSTAGIHFVSILEKLGIRGDVEPHLKPYPNGAMAMRGLAQSSDVPSIGCTQITEIKYTEGVTLVGPLPDEFGLATVYSVAVCGRTTQPDLARRLADLLTGKASESLRAAGGFEFQS
ncbi:MAG TPA: substrate-binding domain-containing protein [Gammaproteobacteria bacterium]|nr:substrate-binding domain-containing protein [Gammaproteobacteria bacterium]